MRFVSSTSLLERKPNKRNKNELLLPPSLFFPLDADPNMRGGRNAASRHRLFREKTSALGTAVLLWPLDWLDAPTAIGNQLGRSAFTVWASGMTSGSVGGIAARPLGPRGRADECVFLSTHLFEHAGCCSVSGTRDKEKKRKLGRKASSVKIVFSEMYIPTAFECGRYM